MQTRYSLTSGFSCAKVTNTILKKHSDQCFCLFVCVNGLWPIPNNFSHVTMFSCLPGLKQYKAEDKVSFSRKQHCAFCVDWLQSLKQFFMNVPYHKLVASLTLMALFFKTEPSELDWLQVFMTH